jgi:predicted ATPase
VTLVGPPGVGKTRLSIQVASEIPTEFPDRVWFVALAAIRDPTLVMPEIAHALGLADVGSQPAHQRLQAALRTKRTLLVLDNFEQIVDAAPSISELLAACPQLKVLATSRVRLPVYGEHEYIVEPLPVPDRSPTISLEELIEYEATRLWRAAHRQYFPPIDDGYA